MEEICNQTIQMCVDEFSKRENKEKIEECILNPLIKHVTKELWPYIFVSILFGIIFISILIVILHYIIKMKNKIQD